MVDILVEEEILALNWESILMNTRQKRAMRDECDNPYAHKIEPTMLLQKLQGEVNK